MSDPPAISTALPVEHLRTELEWKDVALRPTTEVQIREIEAWVKSNLVPTDRGGSGTRAKTGYQVLFHGPAGSGKRSTAARLGRTTGRPVVRIDLSRLVSTYMGETEKNLARLFDQAGEKDWILFLDEADALLAKRTEIRDTHDRYADQATAYLLQAIETYPGLVILATTRPGVIDDELPSRVQASVRFPHPRGRKRWPSVRNVPTRP